MRICIARLRSKVQYIEPLHHIVDSFFEVLKTFMQRNPQHQYTFYNCSFDGSKPVRDLSAIFKADAIIIPSEAEFTYHIPNYFHTNEKAQSDRLVNATLPYFAGKKVIVLRSDRADNEELYKKLLGQSIIYREIDEDEFPANIHSLKFNFIRNKFPLNPDFDETNKVYDFIYWGADKRKDVGGGLSGDERHRILKEVQKSADIESFMIGRFYNMDRNMRMSKMIDIIPILTLGKRTICFNWKSNTATTSRYIEALACGIIPLVWQDYDSTGKMGTAWWQRMKDIDHLKMILSWKMHSKESYYNALESYQKKRVSDITYHDLFEQFLKSKLEL